jgi:protocatechuate 3,4-dioxygenase beta subunit
VAQGKQTTNIQHPTSNIQYPISKETNNMKQPFIILSISLFACAVVAAGAAGDWAVRVVDEQGQPVAGAKVMAIGGEFGQESVATVTRADGAFRFDREKSRDASVVVASKEGKCIDWADWMAADPAKLVLQLGPPAAIEGEIVDDAGKPVLGAAVALLLTKDKEGSLATRMFSPLRAEPFVGKTDGEGRFRFSALPESATVALDITAPGKARTLAEGLAPGQKGIRLVLPAEGRIEGSVVGKGTNNPLAGVEMRAVGSVSSGIHQESATTDKTGRFSMAGMTAGEYRIEIVGKGSALPEWIGWQEDLQIDNGKAAAVKIEAVRGGVLEIQAVDVASGKPIVANGSADVSSATDLMGIRKSAFMGGDGVARLNLPPGKYVVSDIRMTGYSSKRETSGTFSVQTGRTERATLSVTALPPIMLAVSDPTGKPVPGAKARIMPFAQPSRDLVADPTGRVVLDFADVGPWLCSVLVRHPQRNLAAVVFVTDDEQPPVVVLRAPTRVAGTVKDARGRPVVNASVRAQIDASHMGRFAVVAEARTGTDGRFELEVANCMAQYAVSAHAPGFSVAEMVLKHSDIVKESGRDLVLKAADRKLRGVVIDPGGKPVPGAVVTAKANAVKVYPRSAVTDSSGRFALEHLDDEPTIYVYARVPGRGWSGCGTIAPGDQDLTITAAPSTAD